MFLNCLRTGIDKYDPVKLLGEGSFGKVFLMQERKSTELVCVKVINIKNFSDRKVEDTLIEVDLMSRLHHPNIVRYIDSFITKSDIYICMEYCDKVTCPFLKLD
jgi:serine/threonine protein kinase